MQLEGAANINDIVVQYRGEWQQEQLRRGREPYTRTPADYTPSLLRKLLGGAKKKIQSVEVF